MPLAGLFTSAERVSYAQPSPLNIYKYANIFYTNSVTFTIYTKGGMLMHAPLAFLTPQLIFLFLALLILPVLLILCALIFAKKLPCVRIPAHLWRWWRLRHASQPEISHERYAELQRQLLETQEQLTQARRQLTELQKRPKRAQNKANTMAQLAATGETGTPETLLDNPAWLQLVQECISLFDELETKSPGMDPARQEVAGYVCSQLEELLERCGVTRISGDSTFDERLHRPSPAIRRVASGVPIEETLSPGFIVGPRVLRRAHVRLAESTR
jgi:molecular chaperone GrpE (heat shock protein)